MRILIALSFLLFSANLSAQELEAGKKYPGGSKVKSKSLGISLTVPKGWTGQISGEFFVIVGGIDGLVAVRVEEATMAEAKAFLSVPQQLPDGYVFAPNGTPTAKGDTVSVSAKIGQGMQSWDGEFTIRVGKYGQAVGVIAAGEKDALSKVLKTGKQVAKSVSFKKPFVPKPGKSSGPYAEELKGKRLNKYKSSGGYSSSFSSKSQVTLCPDGSFSWYSSSSGYSSGTTVSLSHAGNSQYYGKWSAVGDKLHLFYNDGDKSTYNLTTNEKGHFLMDGTRWLRESISCQ